MRYVQIVLKDFTLGNKKSCLLQQLRWLLLVAGLVSTFIIEWLQYNSALEVVKATTRRVIWIFVNYDFRVAGKKVRISIEEPKNLVQKIYVAMAFHNCHENVIIIHTVDSRYLEHRAISNKTLGPSSINSSGITTRYLELPAISNFLPGPLRVRDSGSRLYIRGNGRTKIFQILYQTSSNPQTSVKSFFLIRPVFLFSFSGWE